MDWTITEIPYSPRYPEVHDVLEAKRFVVLVAHRRFGKTVLVVNHLIRAALLLDKPDGNFAYIGPFRNQAKDVAWKYLKRYTASIPGRSVNESELAISLPSNGGGAKIRIYGADNPDALRGNYFDGVVLDEVAQMKPDVWGEILQPALADRAGWAVFIGTPKGINLFSELYGMACTEQAKPGSQWAALCYPVNVTSALPPAEVERLKNELSENKFRQEMLCDFSAATDETLISLHEVEAALAREPDYETAEHYPLVIGVDVARFGSDSTVFFRRRGRVAYQPLVLNGHSNTEVAHRLMACIAEYRPREVNIDQGQGTGVIDLLRDLTYRHEVIINEIPFGSRAGNPDKYLNRRAEMWMRLRDWLRSGGSLPNYQDCANALRLELCAPSYCFDQTGRIKLEPKEAIKERIQRSPDLADALALTFATEQLPDDETVFPRLADKYGRETAARQRDWLMGKKERKEWMPW